MRARLVSIVLSLFLASAALAFIASPAAGGEPTIAERYAAAKAIEHAALAPPGPFQAAGGDQYIFAFTRTLNHTDAHPVLKVTVLPLAIILDIVLFPLALLADVMT